MGRGGELSRQKPWACARGRLAWGRSQDPFTLRKIVSDSKELL